MKKCDGGQWSCSWCKCKSWQTSGKRPGPQTDAAIQIEDAESNALRDKSKKSIINLTYEFDNVLNECENLLGSETFIGFDSVDYCEEIMSETSSLYKNNSLKELSSSIKNFKSFFNFILLDFIKNKLSKARLRNFTGPIIDVEEIIDTDFIDVEMGDSDPSN